MAWPIMALHAGGNTSHWAILGFSHEFDSALGVQPGPYRLNYFYNDSAVATIVTAFGHRFVTTDGAVNVLNAPTYDAFSRDYLSTLVMSFPADVLVRLWAAVIKVAELPFSDAVSRVSESGLPMGLLPGRVVWALDLRRQWFDALNGTGVVFLVTGIVGLAAFDLRLAAFVFLAFCYLAGSSAIQFQPRHVFHLEFLSLWMLAFVLARTVGLAQTWIHDGQSIGKMRARGLPRMAACAVTIAAVVVVPLAAARLYQRRTAERLLSGYQDAPREPVPLEPQPLEGGWTRFGAPALGASADLPTGPTRAAMVVLQVSPDCNSNPLDVRFAYDAGPSSDFSRTLSVRPTGGAGAPVEVFMPVYYAGADLPDPRAYRFSGVDVPAARTSCVQGLFRLRAPSKNGLLLETVLPPDWRALSLYQSLEAVEHARTYAGGLPR
jgi:hypothetical protein